MPYRPEVLVNNEWAHNALVFETADEALNSGRELMSRWLLVRDYRAVELTDDAVVNYFWDYTQQKARPVQNGGLRPV